MKKTTTQEQHYSPRAVLSAIGAKIRTMGILKPIEEKVRIDKIWNEVAELADVEGKIQHSARHAMGRHLIEKNGNWEWRLSRLRRFCCKLLGGGAHKMLSSVSSRRLKMKNIKIFSTVLLLSLMVSPLMAANYVVTNTSDSGPGSLRQAIIDVNASCTGSDTISFDIATFNASSGGINYYSIMPTTPYPAIRCAVVINGYTQPGAVAGSPLVELSGELMAATLAPSPVDPVLKVSLSYPAGLVLLGRDGDGNVLIPNPSSSTIQGLMINKFPRQAIYIYGADNNTIVGNYFGLDVTGENAGFANARVELITIITGSDDLRLEASSNNFIGTTKADYDQNTIDVASRNFFGSSGRSALAMIELNENVYGLGLCIPATCKHEDIGSSANVIQGNYFGLNKAGNRSIGGFRSNGTVGDPGIDPSAKYSARSGAIYIGGPTAKATVSEGNAAVANAQNRNNVIGGLGVNQGNVIVAHRAAGIILRGPLTSVRGNIMGLDPTGTLITNIVGSGNIPIAGAGMQITNAAWKSIVEGNIIAQIGRGDTPDTFNPGIMVFSAFNLPGPYDVEIRNNIIGTDRTGTLNAGNTGSGVLIAGDICQTRVDAGNACFTRVVGNVIANNGVFPNMPGVLVMTQIFPVGINGPPANSQFTPRNVSILSNSIYGNMGLGIDLNATSTANIGLPAMPATLVGDGVTVNDILDLDDNPTGLPNPTPNHLQNFPVLDGSKSFINPEKAKVEGDLDSIPNRQFLIQIFANAIGDASGHGEGQVFIGEATVTTDDAGHAHFKFNTDRHSPVATDPMTGVCGAAPVLTATATDVLTGETSEFSQWVYVDVKGDAQAYSVRCKKQ